MRASIFICIGVVIGISLMYLHQFGSHIYADHKKLDSVHIIVNAMVIKQSQFELRVYNEWNRHERMLQMALEGMPPTPSSKYWKPNPQ